MRNSVLPCILLALAAACSPSDNSSGSSASSSSGGAAPTTVEEFFTRIFLAHCGYEERCAETRGRQHRSRALCEENARAWVPGWALYLGRSVNEFYAPYYAVSPPDAQACVEAYDTLPCDHPSGGIPIVAQCHNALVPAAGVAETCEENRPWCRPGRHCALQPQGTACVPCEPYRAVGEPCAQDVECETYSCALEGAGSGTCVIHPARRRGETCQANECIGMHLCAGPQGNMTCQAMAEAGTACGGEQPPCLMGLQCITAQGQASGTCQDLLADGATCTRAPDDPHCASACVFPTPDAPTGTCQAVSAFPGAGAPCLDGHTCAPEAYAEFGMASDAFHPTSCECRAPARLGEPCSPNACGEELCEHPTRCAEGRCLDAGDGPRCTSGLANGEACRQADECVSGYCEGAGGTEPGQCQPRPACP
ncbi:MAG: hypothetical protein AB2A00_14440 [Myxococcota bacterium]